MPIEIEPSTGGKRTTGSIAEMPAGNRPNNERRSLPCPTKRRSQLVSVTGSSASAESVAGDKKSPQRSPGGRQGPPGGREAREHRVAAEVGAVAQPGQSARQGALQARRLGHGRSEPPELGNLKPTPTSKAGQDDKPAEVRGQQRSLPQKQAQAAGYEQQAKEAGKALHAQGVSRAEEGSPTTQNASRSTPKSKARENEKER